MADFIREYRMGSIAEIMRLDTPLFYALVQGLSKNSAWRLWRVSKERDKSSNRVVSGHDDVWDRMS